MRLLLNNITPLALMRDASLLFEKRHPAFHNDIIPMDFSYTGKLPIARNAELLNHWHQHQTQGYPGTWPVTLQAGGGLLSIPCTMTISHTDNDFYYYTLKGGSRLSTHLHELPIADLHSEGGDLPDPLTANGGSWPEFQYIYPMYRQNDADFNTKYYWTYVNRYDASGISTTIGGQRVPLAVNLYLMEAITQICRSLGYSVRGDFFLDAELRTVVLWNNFVFEWSGGPPNIAYKYLLPDMTVSEFLTAIKNYFGLYIVFDDLRHEVTFNFLKNLGVGATVRDISRSVSNLREQHFVAQSGVEISQSFDDRDAYAGEHIADIDTDKIEGELDYWFPPGFPDIPPYSGAYAEGQLWFVRLENGYYVLDDPEARYYSYNHKSYTESAQGTQGTQNTFASIAAPVIERLDQLPYPQPPTAPVGSYGTLMPIFDHKHSDAVVWNKFGIRLMFYRGMQDNAGGDSYPLCTSHNIKIKVAGPAYWEAEGVYSLHPNGDTGTYELFYKKWVTYLQTLREFRADIHFDVSDVVNFDPLELYKIGNQHYIFKQIRYKFNRRGILPTEAVLCRV